MGTLNYPMANYWLHQAQQRDTAKTQRRNDNTEPYLGPRCMTSHEPKPGGLTPDILNILDESS